MPSTRTSSATLAPTRNARPTVWRMRTNGNAQSEGDSRSCVLRAEVSIQVKKGSIAPAASYAIAAGLRHEELPEEFWAELQTSGRTLCPGRTCSRAAKSAPPRQRPLSPQPVRARCRRLPVLEHEACRLGCTKTANFTRTGGTRRLESGLLNQPDPYFRIPKRHRKGPSESTPSRDFGHDCALTAASLGPAPRGGGHVR